MRRFLSLILLLLILGTIVPAQISNSPARHIRFGASLPATCSPNTGDVFWKTSATIGMYMCLSANTWTIVESAIGAANITVGTSTITSGTTTRMLYDNGGVVGETTGATTSGGAVTLTSPTLTAAAAGASATLTGTAPTAVGSGTGTAAGTWFSGTGPAGGATSDTTAAINGGAGSNWIVTLGAGGAQTGASSGGARGGTGGGFVTTSGRGGNATSATGTVNGGGGGVQSHTSGAGGTSLTGTGGLGGNFTGVAGAGGISSAAAASGNGGVASLTGGAGGDNSTSGGTAGNGGAANIDAGAKGAASGGASAGSNGNVNIGATNALTVFIGNATASTVTTIQSPKVTFSNTAYHSCTALTTNSAGDIGCTASDAALKEKLAPFNNGLDAIRKIRPQNYQWRSGTQYSDNGNVHLGFVAQNLLEASPFFASKMGNGLLQPEPLAIQAATVSAIQELDAKITALQAIIEKQQKEINRLKHKR